ncbi:MAG TPA: hypothetical protein VM639_00810 [Dongiaceae bacterium]|nr:hypothetical protein [Dongiaceae bacterium]
MAINNDQWTTATVEQKLDLLRAEIEAVDAHAVNLTNAIHGTLNGLDREIAEIKRKLPKTPTVPR